jgi:hypothetical protein
MALMVILAFISMITLYWVPAAMEENEDEHMKDVSNEFSKFKERLDDLIIDNIRNQSVDSTFKLGSPGFPPLARATQGQLTLQPYEDHDPVNNHHIQITLEESGEEVYENSSGYLELSVFNRYFVPQRYTYEQGAIVLFQSSGSIMKTGPNLDVTKDSSGNRNLTVEVTLITLLHDTSDSIQGTGKETVKTELWYTEELEYTNISSVNRDVRFEILSRYATTAWENYFEDNLPTNQGLTSPADYTLGQNVYNPGPSEYRSLLITFNRVKSLKINHAYFWVSIGREA